MLRAITHDIVEDLEAALRLFVVTQQDLKR
jgi:hypothetical protein